MATATIEKTTAERTTVERELLNLEKTYWQAIQDKNVDASARLTEFPCLVAGAMGVNLIDRDAYVKMMKGGDCTLHAFKFDDGAQVRLLTDDVATVGYKVHQDMTVDGKRMKLEAADASVWVRRDGRWRCAMHSESVKGDPFGRDRKP